MPTTARKTKPTGRMFGMNTAYNFVDKDPICDLLRTACRLYTYQQVAVKSGVHANTLRAIFDGATVSPKYSTVARIVRGLGLLVRIGEKAWRSGKK